MDFERLLDQVEGEFRRRGMLGHLSRLAEVRGAYDRRRRSDEGRTAWSEWTVVTWACLLRVPPFNDVFPTRAAGEGCPRCRPQDASVCTFVRLSFRGGYVSQCKACGALWRTDVDNEVLVSAGPRK